jgi:DNA (cytosine-5)-methyltransferase 1
MLNGLDLFSGIGGISLALSDWVRPIAYCEIDPYCQGVLLSRQSAGYVVRAPIWDDIRTLRSSTLGSSIDLIYGGFPCQDISIAGHGKGLAGERSGLFWEIHRLAKEILPKFIFLENVPAITSRGGLTVIRAFAEMGYDCRWCVISAASIGALHRRERWFLLAYSNGNNLRKQYKPKQHQSKALSCSDGVKKYVANTMRKGCQNREKEGQDQASEEPTLRADRESERIRLWKETVSSMDRTTHGIPNRVDRVRALGNSVVPEQAKEAFKILMGIR